MTTLYATKPDTNGNTYFLRLDHERKEYAEQPAGFFHRADAVTVTRRELRRIKADAIANGYKYKN
jgi:hypothetical protein